MLNRPPARPLVRPPAHPLARTPPLPLLLQPTTRTLCWRPPRSKSAAICAGPFTPALSGGSELTFRTNPHRMAARALVFVHARLRPHGSPPPPIAGHSLDHLTAKIGWDLALLAAATLRYMLVVCRRCRVPPKPTPQVTTMVAVPAPSPGVGVAEQQRFSLRKPSGRRDRHAGQLAAAPHDSPPM